MAKGFAMCFVHHFSQNVCNVQHIIQVQEHKSATLHRYKSTRLQEYKKTKVQEYKSTRTQKYKRQKFKNTRKQGSSENDGRSDVYDRLEF